MIRVLAAALTLTLAGCANDFIYRDASKVDANDKCIESHVWDTTGSSGWGTSMQTCSATKWYLERRRIDGL